jgi:hypothetical protein
VICGVLSAPGPSRPSPVRLRLVVSAPHARGIATVATTLVDRGHRVHTRVSRHSYDQDGMSVTLLANQPY